MQGATQTVVGVVDAAAHIMDVARDEAAKCKEAARNDNNEFNIRKNFLENAVNSIRRRHADSTITSLPQIKKETISRIYRARFFLWTSSMWKYPKAK